MPDQASLRSGKRVKIHEEVCPTIYYMHTHFKSMVKRLENTKRAYASEQFLQIFFNIIQCFFHMSIHFNLPPFLNKYTISIYDKGRTFNTHIFFSKIFL